jgi:outer membrane protein assembly factor BamB
MEIFSNCKNDKKDRMKTMTTSFIALLFLITSLGCKKEPVTPVIPIPVDTNTYQTKLDIKWIQWYDTDTVGAYMLDPMFFGDYVAFCTRSLVNESKGSLGFAIFNRITGERHPVWDHYFPDLVAGTSDDIPDWRLCGQNGDIAVLTTRNRLFAWDLSTGQMLWQHHHAPYFGLHKLSSVGSVPYHSYYHGTNKIWNKLARFNPVTGTKEDLVEIPKLDNVETRIMPVSYWVSPANGDTMLLFVTNGINFSLSRDRVDAYAFNQTTRTMLWQEYDICQNRHAAIYPPLVVGDKVVFQGASSIHCFDIPSGTLLWEHLYDRWAKGFMENLYGDGKVFVRNGTSVLAYDLQTGALLWETSNRMNLQMRGAMGFYQGKVYFTATDDLHPGYAKSLFCVDANTGSVIWKDPGPSKNGGLTFGIIIDQSTGYLYATDAYRMMCIDLNNTPKP